MHRLRLSTAAVFCLGRVALPALALAFGTASLLLLPAALQAQSSCSSDGVAAPTQLLERFTNAACADCWSDKATTPAPRGAIAIDWIVPAGDDAPLAAAATRDALDRLSALSLVPPTAAFSTQRAVNGTGSWAARSRLRVAHGLPVNDYVGTSLRWSLPLTGAPAGTTAWLLLVEALPAGAEGSVVQRNLVRAALVLPADPGAATGSARPFPALQEARAMRIPEGVRPERLRLVGWVHDGAGRVLVAAQSRCSVATAAKP